MAKKSTPKEEYESSDENVSMLEEPMEMYRYAGANIGKWAILSGAASKPESQMTSFEKMNVVRNGVSKKDLELLKKKAALDYSMLAKALSVTRATLINKKKEQKFNMALSEKIFSLADLYSFGFEVFGDESLFNQWMLNPNRALGGQVPYDLIDNQYGREEIKNLIGRIAYGVYS
jgi:putative toxin-antitoxin system antitoxin component (TIGR02293 family)